MNGSSAETKEQQPHIRWAPPSQDDVVEHDAESHHRHLESPPPPISVSGSLSPTIQKKIILSAEAPTGIQAPIAKYPSTVDSGSGSATQYSLRSVELRGNLTREQKNRDPMMFYEVVAVLGVGSMGSVAQVRKREDAVGGSARVYNQERVKREQLLKRCWSIPLLGGFFRNCIGGKVESIFMQQQDAVVDRDGQNSASGEIVYAMKSIHLSRVTDPTFIEELKNEITILKRLDHPHIVRAIETYEHRHQIFVIMELCSGGDLYSRDPYTEEEAARITSSILSAVSYMHANNILHRDLKYENIMFVNDSPHAEIKLIDFGLSKKFVNEELTEGVGTIYTMAPEVLRGSYTEQADLWSLGVIAFMLLSSQMPFYGRKKEHIIEQIMAGKFEFKGRRWKKVSKTGRAFVKDLLVVDPEDRATADEALRASWLNRRLGATIRSPREEEIDNAKSSVIRFANYTKLQRMALMVIAHKSTSEEIGILRKLFQQYDTKKDGQLSYEEFKAAIQEAGYSEQDYRSIFDAVDLDGTGKIRYTEFLAATMEAHGVISEDRLAEAFDRLDADDSGYISATNLSEMLGNDFPQEEIEAIINEVSKDGKVSYGEFLALWEHRKEQERAKVMKEIDIIGNTSFDLNVSSDVSVLSDEFENDEDKTAVQARASFIEGKKMSERKVHQSMVEPTVKDDASERHVIFNESPVIIPDTAAIDDEAGVLSSDV